MKEKIANKKEKERSKERNRNKNLQKRNNNPTSLREKNRNSEENRNNERRTERIERTETSKEETTTTTRICLEDIFIETCQDYSMVSAAFAHEFKQAQKHHEEDLQTVISFLPPC